MSLLHPRRPVALAVLVTGCAVLAACGSSATPTTVTHPARSTTTTAPAASTTTTTLDPATRAVLQPRLLTLSDLPKQWFEDKQAGAADVSGSPDCLAHVITAPGAASKLSAVFLGPTVKSASDVEPAVLQTVARYPAGAAAGAVAALHKAFLGCNGASLTRGTSTAKLGTRAVSVGSTGDGGFAEQLVVAVGSDHAYYDVFVGVRGDDTTQLVWRDGSASTSAFQQAAAGALARL